MIYLYRMYRFSPLTSHDPSLLINVGFLRQDEATAQKAELEASEKNRGVEEGVSINTGRRTAGSTGDSMGVGVNSRDTTTSPEQTDPLLKSRVGVGK